MERDEKFERKLPEAAARPEDSRSAAPTEKTGRSAQQHGTRYQRQFQQSAKAEEAERTAEQDVFETVTAVLDSGGHSFTAKGKTVNQDGWKAVLSAFKTSMKQKSQENDEEEATLPTLTVGQVLSGVQVSVREGKTSPPKHFTDVICYERGIRNRP